MNSSYQTFRNNTFIDSIAHKEKWTVSTNKKVPIDMYMFMYRNVICGAIHNNDLSLVSLDVLHQQIPDAANYAFYLDALVDNFVILDIEPKCPDDIRAKLVTMPCLYCETSMSGKGIHMIFTLPKDILNKYPEAKEKIVFKEPHGWYEILINHYATFTGNQIPANIDTNDDEFRALFKEMAQEQKVVAKADVNIKPLESVDTYEANFILKSLASQAHNYTKKLSDFNDDHSKYEFSINAFLYHKLLKMLNAPAIQKSGHVYTDSEIAWFLYKTTSEFLTPRAKHDEERNGMPWLLYLASEVIAHNKNDEKAKREEKKS